MTVKYVKTDVVPVAELHPHPENPNRGAVDEIAESLGEFGQYRSIVALTDGTILAGHHVVQALEKRGETSVRVDFIDTDEQTAKRILLADNRLPELGEGLNPEQLLRVLEDLGADELAGTGYDTDFIDELASVVEGNGEPVGDPEEPGDVPKWPGRTKEGQSWRLGPHRLLIGDATDTETVMKWMAGEKADCVWTDPPYGVDYVGKTKDALTIQNDGAADLPELLSGAFRTVINVARKGAPVYIAHADTERVVFEQTARAAGIIVRQNLIWVKNTIVMGRSDYHYRHEPVLYGNAGEGDDDTPYVEPAAPSAEFQYSDEHEPLLYGFTPPEDDHGRLGRGGPHWYGDHKQATTFFVDKPAANKDHPTMKPVELIVAMLANSCRPGGIVFDPFGGSGSTMAAAHITGRSARLVELDPRYGEAIIKRYEQLTGEVAVLED